MKRWIVVPLCWMFATLAIGQQLTRPARNVVPLPTLPAQVEMRVAHVVNPRLPRMSGSQLQVLLAATSAAVREHFGVDIRFPPPVEIDIDELFRRVPAERARIEREQIYDFKSGMGDPERLGRAFGRAFRSSGESLTGMVEFVRPHVPDVKATYEDLGIALAALQLRGIERWKTIKALDGGPAIDGNPYNEFRMWVALGYGDVPFELLLTNQLIASVEYAAPAVHAAIRGGYSNGVTTYSGNSRFKTMSVWSTFAFTSEDEWVKQLRGGEVYGADEAARLAGISAAHEIGHQLFHFLHPFERNACLMSPVPMFAYRAWAEKLSSKACPVGSNPEMRPGAYRFLF